MKSSLYAKLQRVIITITLLVSFTPLILLSVTVYYRFSEIYEKKIEEQIKYRAQAHAEAIDLFLGERTALLCSMADIFDFKDIIKEENLSRVFTIMNTRAGAFVDLGVIDKEGSHRAYVGPYELKGVNYYQQPWFAEVMSKGVYISDVYMGFRNLPHFIIAVRRQVNNETWILRATVDLDIFEGLVRAAQVGKTGDAYLVNKDGLFQTDSRFSVNTAGNGSTTDNGSTTSNYGKILSDSYLDTSLFGSRSNIIKKKLKNGSEEELLYAGSWLKSKNWLLVIAQNPTEELSSLFTTRKVGIIIIVAGLLAIIMTIILTTRLLIDRLKRKDLQMNELNAQLVQSDKLAAIGKMAAGVAHEINNPLAVIAQKTGWMEDLLIEEEFQNSKNLQEYINSIRKIEEHVERARKVVFNMLGFARKMEPHQEEVDITKTLQQTISLLDNYARINNIQIQMDCNSDLPIIAGDQGQLQQVFFNLISNAIDAISGTSAPSSNGLISITCQQTKTHISISIIDNGPGISEDQKKKVFDPFYTTKITGKGTGLGLWVSYNIVKKMGGTINLQSQLGKGATFTVEIPIKIPENKNL